MTLIQVTDFRLDAKAGKQPPTADSEDHLLPEAQLLIASIQFAGDRPILRGVSRVVAVQQVESYSAHLDLPGPQPDRVTVQGGLQSQPLTVRSAHRSDRQLSRIVIGEESLLCSLLVDHLAKVTLLVEQPHCGYRHTQVACGLELIPSHVAEPA